ncbi:MAG: hypothetical protein GY845_04290, partial [Planctomycetes bacterium]|nr:hypothetical protein [Planctomycetota bacterium]
MVTKRVRSNTSSQLKNRIAKVVFDAADYSGIPDREGLEKLTELVIDRLSISGPVRMAFPGMEDLVVDEVRSPKVSEEEIQSKVKEVLAEVTLAPVREAAAKPEKLGRKSKHKAEEIELSTN